MNPLCPLCTGVRPFCIHKSYPLPQLKNFGEKVKSLLKEKVAGPSYSVFVGRDGYPDVGIGPMVGIEENPLIGASPDQWYGKSYGKIIEARSLLVRSSQKEHIFSRSRFIEENQTLALTSRPTDTEISYEKKPFYRFFLSDYLQPMGPTGKIKNMTVTENPKVPLKVEKVVRDDLKAAEASFSLYQKNQDVYKITTILSSGILGAEQQKKMVPTRWSITATDDIVAKEMMKSIRENKELQDYLVFESKYMDNHFVIVMMPGSWEFENYETWAPGSNWYQEPKAGTHGSPHKIIPEYEPFNGRTHYSHAQAGGYYASRLAAVEYLYRKKRQAKVIVFREIGEHYTIPLGVWIVRETARNAYKNPRKFSTKEDALAYADSRTRIPLSEYRKKSTILCRRTLADFTRF